VYDEETGLYYLRSRYYNPEWGRFINADTVLGSTGALLSHNLFAYCGNNSVNKRDPSGNSPLSALRAAIAQALKKSDVAKYAKSAKNVGYADPYWKIPAQTAVNCYAYVYGFEFMLNPGEFCGKFPSKWNDVEDVYNSIYQDNIAGNSTCRRLDGPDGWVASNEWRAALRVGTTLTDYGDGNMVYDYHLMVQTSTGQWAEKPGSGATILHDVGRTPNTIPWLKDGAPYYDSNIIYFAIGITF